MNPRFTGRDLLPSDSNYLVVNGAVINVNFGDPVTDAETLAKMTALYSGRTIERLNLDNLHSGGGGIHCVTQQQWPSLAHRVSLPRFLANQVRQ